MNTIRGIHFHGNRLDFVDNGILFGKEPLQRKFALLFEKDAPLFVAWFVVSKRQIKIRVDIKGLARIISETTT